ncbi:MAG: 2-oxoacid:ferredoxin oxidoreductase subunit beta [Armatimonadetes bacterium]|nr:2-oxoacid:ferredoxin oxidoreductase subunit beta [Armatimonadota bacterium]
MNVAQEEHPIAPYLRMDRMPHMWCPSCGIGIVLKCFATALEKTKMDLDKVSVVSGIGCTGRTAGYVRLDSFHTTHGRAIPFATGLKLARPDLKVVVFSGDGDLLAIGGNHFIHAAKRNMDLTVILVNNFIYGMTGGQLAPTTPTSANTSTTPYGNFETPFSVPKLAEACGATYVARWTCLDVRRVTRAMQDALQRKGFSIVEVIAPCPVLYARRNKLGAGLEMLQYYKEKCEICHEAGTENLEIAFQDKIPVGKFVDKPRPTFQESMHEWYRSRLGDKYKTIE